MDSFGQNLEMMVYLLKMPTTVSGWITLMLIEQNSFDIPKKLRLIISGLLVDA